MVQPAPWAAVEHHGLGPRPALLTVEALAVTYLDHTGAIWLNRSEESGHRLRLSPMSGLMRAPGSWS